MQIVLFAWCAHDSARVLGLGLSRESAYKDAAKRHADLRGYIARVTLDQFPQGGNPALALRLTTEAGAPPTAFERGVAPREKSEERSSENARPENVQGIKTAKTSKAVDTTVEKSEKTG